MEMAEEFKRIQDHLDAEQDDQALRAAEEAVTKFRQAKQQDSMADALLLNICALIAKGCRKEANKLAQDELATFAAAGSERGQATMLLASAEANSQHRGKENKKKALEAAEKSKAMFSKLGDKRMEAKAHIVIANIQILNGHIEQAIRTADTAKDLAKSVDDMRGRGIAKHCIAVALAKAPRTNGNENGFDPSIDLQDSNGEDCIKAVQEAIECFQKAGIKQMEAFERICLAKWTHERLSKPAKALQLALRAQTFCRSCGLLEHKALGVVVECYMALAKKDSTGVGSSVMSAKAVRSASEAINHFQATGDRVGEAHGLQSMAMAQISQGLQDEAAHTAQKAADAFRDVNEHDSEMQMLLFASSLHYESGQFSKAAAAAEEIVEKTNSPQNKVAALEAAFQAYMQNKEWCSAKETAKAMCELLREAKNPHKEGIAKLLMCQAHYKNQDVQPGVAIGREAQILLQSANDTLGEAKALRTVAKIHFFAKDYESAQRSAVQARELVRNCDDPQAEGDAAILLSNIRLQILRELDSRTTNEVFSARFFEMADAAKEAKWIGQQHGNVKLVACALKLMAEGALLVNEFAESLKYSSQAAQLFREAEDEWNLAHLLLVEAHAWCGGGVTRNANQSCKQALKIFQELCDETGITKCEETMERINPATPPPEQSAIKEETTQATQEVAPKVAQPKEEAEEAPAGPVYTRKNLSKINPNKIDPDLLVATIYDVIQDVVGYEMDFLNDDLPLMQAGVASRQATTLRAQLEQELGGGIQFPATVVFDFPNIASLRDFVMDQA